MQMTHRFLADTPENLQRFLNSLHEYIEQWDLKVSTFKTKIAVFRSSWQLHDIEKSTFDENIIEVVCIFFVFTRDLL